MKIAFRYDPEADAGYFRISDADIDHTVDLETTQLNLPVLIDVDADGAMVGIEILNVSTTAPSLVRVVD